MSDLVDQHQMQEAMGQLKAMREQPAPEPEAEPEEQPARPRRPERSVEAEDDGGEDLHFANDDEAYEHLQDLKDHRTHDSDEDDHASRAPAHSDDAGSDSDSTSADPSRLWSTNDLETMIGLQQAEQAFRADFEAYTQLKSQIDLNALEAQDRGKAAAVRERLGAIEADLRQSYDAINSEAQRIHGKVNQHHAANDQKRIAAEQKKLERLAPNLDKQALVTYLTGPAGFSQQELADATGDARLISVLEKARLYDEMQEGKGPRKRPRMAKGAKGRTSASPGRSPDAVSAAMDKLKRDGTMDSALEYLRVSKQQRKGAR